ncbi:MAG: glycosyltransferase family 4 protein [Candidatus Pacebacteria bacterium]|nr:glycosyltransferase family 4 protein [Candidatus Paceibacterota bacterium]
MKILFAAGIYPPEVGGPSNYAYELKQELEKLGNKVDVVMYRPFRKIPSGLRHFAYLIKLLLVGGKADVILGFDYLSVGLPAVLAGKILRKKVVLRIGGDFLWEEFVERTQKKILLSKFYEEKRVYTFKEKLIFIFTRFVFRNCSAIVFNSGWLRDIFVKAYRLDVKKTKIIENAYEFAKIVKLEKPTKKVFIWAGRQIFFKNISTLELAFENAKKKNPSLSLKIIKNALHKELIKEIESCYAVIYPSLSEVNPNLVLEGISCGKPSIVTEETGINDFLEGKVVFANPLDQDDITEKILSLANDETYQKCCKQIKKITQQHTYIQIGKEYKDLIESTI